MTGPTTMLALLAAMQCPCQRECLHGPVESDAVAPNMLLQYIRTTGRPPTPGGASASSGSVFGSAVRNRDEFAYTPNLYIQSFSEGAGAGAGAVGGGDMAMDAVQLAAPPAGGVFGRVAGSAAAAGSGFGQPATACSGGGTSFGKPAPTFGAAAPGGASG